MIRQLPHLDTTTIARFAADLAALAHPGQRVGVAVSGGPDSLALLLLAHAARPGAIAAVTVDHRLRDGSAAEAAMVAEVCASLGVPHHILDLHWPKPPTANLQAQAREQRYVLLARWAATHRLPLVATAHHADDQAETLLMRLARGAGLSGLVATRVRRKLAEGIDLIRPLLGWRKEELAGIVGAAGLTAVDDPANRDPRHDRTRMREMLREAEWADPVRLAATANWLAEADAALDWALGRLRAERVERDGNALSIDPRDIPPELLRRLLLAAFAELGAHAPRGPELARATAALAGGKAATLSGLKLEPGARWRLSPAPPRRG
ncbi:MAG: tRNA lysidine(34) synthetase TilS [Sphingomicrobium sp.]